MALKFDLSYYIKELGLTEAELNKATEHYTKGKFKKFRDLVGQKNKNIRRDITANLVRNKGKFIDPILSKKFWLKDSYQEIKKWIDDFETKNKRLPTKREVSKGTGYAVQGAIDTGAEKGIYKTYKGIPSEIAKVGAAKRAVLLSKTAETATVPIPKRAKVGPASPENPVTHLVWPNKKIGNKTYKQAFIDDLKLRYKYPMQSVEAKAAGVLSDVQMAKKYGIGSLKSLPQYIYYANRFENIDPTFPKKSSEALLATKEKYRGLLKDIQGKAFIPKGLHGTVGTGTHLQHALLKNPKLPITAENLVFIPARMNSKYIRKLETVRDNITAERDLLLKNKPKNWVKKVEFLNNKGMEIPAQTEGVVQFETIDHKGNKYVHKLGSEKYQLDVAGLNKGKLLKDYTKADWDTLRLNVDQARKAGSKIPVPSSKVNIQTILESFKNLANPQKIKTAVALNCIAAAEGGRIGYALGSATINCVNTKLTNDPIQSSLKLRVAEGVGKIKPAATNFLKMLGRGGVKAAPYAAIGALGVAAEPLVKKFYIDDPTTYLTDENQQKGFLLSMIEAETPKVDQEILNWQYPGMAAATAAGAIPGAGAVYKARRGIAPSRDFIGPMHKGVGKTRAALGLSGVLGKALGASFSPLAAAATTPFHIASQRKAGTDWADIAASPGNWMGPAFMGGGYKMAAAGIKNPTLLKALRLGMSPRALMLGSRFGLAGLLGTAGLAGYDMYKNLRKKEPLKAVRYPDEQ